MQESIQPPLQPQIGKGNGENPPSIVADTQDMGGLHLSKTATSSGELEDRDTRFDDEEFPPTVSVDIIDSALFPGSKEVAIPAKGAKKGDTDSTGTAKLTSNEKRSQTKKLQLKALRRAGKHLP